MFIEGISIVALTTGLTQVLKGIVPEMYKPALGVCIGILLSIGYFYSGGDGTFFSAVVFGVMYGLSANGLYDNVTAFKK